MNSGPPIEQILQTLLDNQAKSDCRLNAITEEISALNSKANRLSDILEVVQEMKAKIDYLEKTVTCEAERLIDLENRSRRNNLVFFGVEEQHKESEADLSKVVKYLESGWALK